jgi:hypothetical protein
VHGLHHSPDLVPKGEVTDRILVFARASYFDGKAVVPAPARRLAPAWSRGGDATVRGYKYAADPEIPAGLP